MNFYCRSYCLLNMVRAPLCPSPGAREYYTSGCCLPYLVLGFQVVGMVWSWGLCVRFAGCCQAPNTADGNNLYNTLELLMMGIMVPETCWAGNKICNKNSSFASSWHFISTYYILSSHVFFYLRVFRFFSRKQSCRLKNGPSRLQLWQVFLQSGFMITF